MTNNAGSSPEEYGRGAGRKRGGTGKMYKFHGKN